MKVATKAFKIIIVFITRNNQVRREISTTTKRKCFNLIKYNRVTYLVLRFTELLNCTHRQLNRAKEHDVTSKIYDVILTQPTSEHGVVRPSINHISYELHSVEPAVFTAAVS